MARRAIADIEEIERLDAIDGWPAPEEQASWYGAADAEETLLEAYRSGKMHHAWLIGGPKGIGKATLAYRFARFILAHPDLTASNVAEARNLSLPEDHPVFRKVASRAHPNLLVLERPWNEETKRYRTELTVSEIRRTVSFFGSTAAEDGWRIAIVDPADDMNASAANALLKVLEEPPARGLFLLVCHAPGRLLPTIRSRCRRLDLAPLPDAAIGTALAGRGSEADSRLASALAEGSLRNAILLIEEEGLDQYRDLARLLSRLPRLDIQATHRFADRVAGRGSESAYLAFLEHVRGWLARRVRRQPEPESGALPMGLTAVPLERWAEVWEKVTQSSDLAEALNLDRKQVVLSTFMTLARATRM
jgi:DNA polymerase-3 subunit delta'